jgi:hypothetical protein
MDRTVRGSAAFGLIALLVVLAIVLLLYFGNAGGGNYAQQLSEARKQGQRLEMRLNTQQLTLLIATYRQQNGKMPRTWEEMEAPPAAYTDPWGHAMTVAVEEERAGGARVTYRSAGPDGEPNTGDDLVQTDALPF